MSKTRTFYGSFWYLFKAELRRYAWKEDYPLWTVVTVMAVALALVYPVALVLIPIVVFSSVIRCFYRAYQKRKATGSPIHIF